MLADLTIAAACGAGAGPRRRPSSVWVSDNGGYSVVGFTSDPPVTIEVGPSPHHLLFVDGALLVAVSGTSGAVFIEDGRTVARAELSRGLHGVARVVLQAPLDDSDNSG